MARLVAAITIGQRPRPDLLAPLLDRLPTGVEVVEEGALDGLTPAELADRLPSTTAPGDPTADPYAGRYPLTTRLRDGTPVTLDEADLAPLVQAAVERAERAGADVTLLLCAGGFLGVVADGPLVRPFDAAVEQLRAMGARRVAVAVPSAAQAPAAALKWAAAGFEPVSIVGEPATLVPPATAVDAIVLDYVGHPAEAVAALRGRTRLPVVDLGACGAEAAVRQLERDDAPRTVGAR